MAFLVRLLADPQVERRLHADHVRHMLWEDAAVQRHLAMMRRAVETGEMPTRDDDNDDEVSPHEQRHDQHHDHQHHHDHDPGMHRAMELFVRMLADPEVDARIHADPELHHLWADPAVQRHIVMMREMHPVPGEPEDRHHDH